MGLRQDRDAVGSDLVGGIAVGGDSIGPDDDHLDLAFAHDLGGHVVADESHGDAAALQFPGGRAAHPGAAGGFRRRKHAGACPVRVRRRSPRGRFRNRRLPGRRRCSGSRRHVPAGGGPRRCRPIERHIERSSSSILRASARSVSSRAGPSSFPLGRQAAVHAVKCPEEIDGGGPAGAEGRGRFRERAANAGGFVRALGPCADHGPIGRGDSDGGRSPDPQRFDGLPDCRHVATIDLDVFGRKQGLVDHLQITGRRIADPAKRGKGTRLAVR